MKRETEKKRKRLLIILKYNKFCLWVKNTSPK